MGGLFKTPKIKTPEVPAPIAIPEVSEETGEEAMRAAVRRSGRTKTKITGSLRPISTKKTFLG